MEFNPEFAQSAGGDLSTQEYKMHRLHAHGMAEEAAHAHMDHVLSTSGMGGFENAVHQYSVRSTALNHWLLKPAEVVKNSHPNAIHALAKIHKHLLSMIKDAPPVHADMDIYSGVSQWHANNLLAKYKKGDTASSNAWISCSHLPDVAGKFAGTKTGSASGRDPGATRTILHVRVRKGQKGVMHIAYGSMHPNEKESLLAPNTRLRINKVYEPESPEKRRIISAEIID